MVAEREEPEDHRRDGVHRRPQDDEGPVPFAGRAELGDRRVAGSVEGGGEPVPGDAVGVDHPGDPVDHAVGERGVGRPGRHLPRSDHE